MGIVGSGGAAPFIGLLDTYTGASIGYSLRKLKATTTNVVRIRRSSDSVEQDFTAAEITDGTLTTFTGANDGFVAKWYDQSGNSNDAFQSTAISQPKLVSIGVVITDNGKPALQYDSTGNLYLEMTSIVTTNRSVFLTLNAEVVASSFKNYILGGTWMHDYDSGASQQWLYSAAPAIIINGDNRINGVTTDFTTTSRVTTQVLLTLIHTASAGRFSGISKDRTNNGRSWQGKYQEIIIYPTDQTSNSSAIESNISAEYVMMGDTATSGLLFDYPNSSGAYSLRQLTNYANNFKTNVIRVRHSVNNTEQDFNADEIIDGTLTAFTGSDDGFVTTWYDQSGNSNNLTMISASLQGKIVSAGSVLTTNGKPAVSMFNNSRYLFTTAVTPYTIFNLSEVTQKTVNYVLWGSPTVTGCFLDGSAVSGNVGVYSGGVKSAFSSPGGQQLTYYNYNGTNYNISQNAGSDTALSASGVVSATDFGRASSNLSINAFTQETVLYPTDVSSDKTGILNNINTHYVIY